MHPDWFFYLSTTAKALFIWGVTLVFILINIFLERKVCAIIQDRVGPNRAHILGIRLFGFILNFADAVKLLYKEDVVPKFVNKPYYFLAPVVIMALALLAPAVIPFAGDLQIGGRVIRMQLMDPSIGFLFILGITSLSVYSLVLGGWGSNSKYPLLAAMRSSAQMISYEIAMGLALVGLVMVFGTLTLGDLVRSQGDLLFGFLPQWGILVQPIGAVIFFIAVLAEINRNPFDLPEGESEIIGFHAGYSSMKFALFFMAEYANIFVASAVFTTLYMGGWQVPWLTTETIALHASAVFRASMVAVAVCTIVVAFLLARFYRGRRYRWNDMRRNEPVLHFAVLALVALIAVVGFAGSWFVPFGPAAQSILACSLQLASFLGKCLFFCFVIVWIRWTLPRFRYDQLMALGWKILLPLGIGNLLVTGIVLLIG